jgi:hypothetical protein
MGTWGLVNDYGCMNGRMCVCVCVCVCVCLECRYTISKSLFTCPVYDVQRLDVRREETGRPRGLMDIRAVEAWKRTAP